MSSIDSERYDQCFRRYSSEVWPELDFEYYQQGLKMIEDPAGIKKAAKGLQTLFVNNTSKEQAQMCADACNMLISEIDQHPKKDELEECREMLNSKKSASDFRISALQEESKLRIGTLDFFSRSAIGAGVGVGIGTTVGIILGLCTPIGWVPGMFYGGVGGAAVGSVGTFLWDTYCNPKEWEDYKRNYPGRALILTAVTGAVVGYAASLAACVIEEYKILELLKDLTIALGGKWSSDLEGKIVPVIRGLAENPKAFTALGGIVGTIGNHLEQLTNFCEQVIEFEAKGKVILKKMETMSNWSFCNVI